MGYYRKYLRRNRTTYTIGKTIPALKPGATLVDWIEKKAVAGVKAAEQLAHAGSLATNEEKFNAAQNTVYAALKEINVEPTLNQKKLISDFIQEAVNDLDMRSYRVRKGYTNYKGTTGFGGSTS
ncbi:phage holin, LLH family [Clostridium kluyveri]|uniref:phage holin, LLH family n=1 Tax=Clostridium kluyveri TaxID=1534 RepID=UPI00325A605C